MASVFNLKTSGLDKEPGVRLFPDALGKMGKLSTLALVRTDAADMLKRRLQASRLIGSLLASPGDRITNFLENDGTLGTAQRIDDQKALRPLLPASPLESALEGV